MWRRVRLDNMSRDQVGPLGKVRSDKAESRQLPCEINAEERNALRKKREDQLEVIKEHSKDYIFIAICFGILFTFCFFDYYDNFSGIVYLMFVSGLYILTKIVLNKLEKPVRKPLYGYVVASILLAISTVITENGLITSLNTIGILVMYLIFLSKVFLPEREWGFGTYILVVLKSIVGSIDCSGYLFRHSKGRIHIDKKSSAKMKTILLGVVLAAVFLFFVLPLLFSADAVFSSLILGRFKRISFELNYQVIRIPMILIVSTFIFYGGVCAFTCNYMMVEELVQSKWKTESLTIMTAIIAITYVVFCGVQVTYLFGGFFQLPDGITYSEYARQGFMQLLCVAIINIMLVLIIKGKCEENTKLKQMLSVVCICTFIMIISAGYRMILYINAYDLSILRVLVLWFLAVLFLIVAQILYYIYHSQFPIARTILHTVIILYLMLSFSRIDYIVASYNIANSESLLYSEVEYLTYLSEDAAPAIDKLSEESYLTDTQQEIIKHYFGRVGRNHNQSWRYFNLSEYIAYRISERY